MSMAVKYGMKKRQKMADGGEPKPAGDAAKRAAESMRKAFRYAGGGDVNCSYCKGGECMEHGGVVDRIMIKRMSEGGQVANDTNDNMADSKEAQYDDLVLRDDLEADYTGANSGDELGNEALDEDDHDLVGRIMRSRGKKDKMPRPA